MGKLARHGPHLKLILQVLQPVVLRSTGPLPAESPTAYVKWIRDSNHWTDPRPFPHPITSPPRPNVPGT